MTPPPSDWNERQRLEFLEGWCFQRLGYPNVAPQLRTRFFTLGIREAINEEERKANEPS